MLTENEVKTIQEVAQETPTSKAVFDSWIQRQRFSQKTNLDKFKVDLLNQGEKIVDEEFQKTFKRLEDLGIGSIIHGRGKNPARFVWNYNLKDVAQMSMGNLSAEKVAELPVSKKKIKRKLLTPKKSVGRPKKIEKSPTIRVTFDIPGNSDPQEIAALLDLVASMEKK